MTSVKNATSQFGGMPTEFEMYTGDSIPFIIGIVIIGGLLVALVISLICLCVVNRKRRDIISEYSQLETESDSETIPLKALTEDSMDKRKIKQKGNKKKTKLFRKNYLSEDFLLENGYENIQAQRDYLLGINTSFVPDKAGCIVPMIEKECIPATLAIPIQSKQRHPCFLVNKHEEFQNVEEDPPSQEAKGQDKASELSNKTSDGTDSSIQSHIHGSNFTKTNLDPNLESFASISSITTVPVMSNVSDKSSIVTASIEEQITDDEAECTLTFLSGNYDDEDFKSSAPGKLPLAFQIPIEITDSIDPARGLLAFSLSLRRLKDEADPVSLLVHIFEARCILTGQVRHDAWFGVGKFYVKARLNSTALKRSPSMGSIASLDQSILSRSIIPNMNSGSNISSSSGRTKAKSACRTIRFLETIELPFPKPWRKLISDVNNNKNTTKNCIGVSKFGRKRSISTSELDVKPLELNLRLTLKQRETSGKAAVLKRLNLNLGGKMELGTISVPCPPSLLAMIDVGSTASELIAPPCSTLKPFLSGDVGSMQVSQPGLLRMVQEISPLVNSSPGLINLAMQWKIETKTLTCRAIDCSSISVPLGTKNLFVSYSLMSNCEIISVVNSKPAVKHSRMTCEFLLTDTTQFPLAEVEDGLENVCLGVALVAALGGLKNSEVLLGRLVLGPDGLAYGSGLRHWSEVTRKRGLIRRSHWFS